MAGGALFENDGALGGIAGMGNGGNKGRGGDRGQYEAETCGQS
jgi:hypothetical protein